MNNLRLLYSVVFDEIVNFTNGEILKTDYDPITQKPIRVYKLYKNGNEIDIKFTIKEKQ